MRLIGLAVVLTLSLTIAPLAAEAQKTVKHPRVGILSTVSPPSEPGWQQRSQRSPFWQAMRELGWIEGQNIMVERRWAGFQLDRLPALAAELVQLKVDLILTNSGGETLAAKTATKTIPIVRGCPGPC
jgi:ABC-type uncharacterized transport system substrate-binding protein